MQIGSYTLDNQLILAPMAGITDRPFRQLCRTHGAALTFSEMITSSPQLRSHHRTRLKYDHAGETGPIAVQLLGTDPAQLADTARFCADQGAQIIDINMGCPAKKVCRVSAGSALMRNQALATRIMESVINAVNLPVTLKIRSGWDSDNKNAVEIARIAELSGIQAVTVHGRTRQCGYHIPAEYETVTAVKQAINIPVIANGDIDTPEKALSVLQITGADAIMCGRAAQGRPWIFQQIADFIDSRQSQSPPPPQVMRMVITQHLTELYEFYGQAKGVRIARKHINWYLRNNSIVPKHVSLRDINKTDNAEHQLAQVTAFFDHYVKDIAA